jgi:high-affinity iron transporter
MTDRAVRAFRAVLASGLLALVVAVPASAADPAAGTPADGDPLQPYIELIRGIRGTLDESLAAYQGGDATGAFAAARRAYLDSFELVEVPLRQRDPDMTLEMEDAFAVMRADIKAGQPVAVVTDDVARLQNGLDDVERTLSLQGYAPLVVAGTSFVIVLRGGLESVILVGSILGYLAAARASHMRTAVFAGVASALGATVATWFVFQTILRIAPIRPSLVQAIPALVAVVILVVFAYWLLARLDRRRWLEFMSASVFTAVAAGSAAALFLLGFTAVYRQGFESVAFFQGLLAYSTGLEKYLVVGAILGVLALIGLTVLIFRLGRAVPVTAFLAISIVLVMAISVAFLGNAVRGLQEAYVIPITNLTGSLPRLPIYLAQATGYHPTTETLVAQGLLILTYVVTGAWVVVLVRRRRRAADARMVAAAAATAARGSAASSQAA